MTPTYADGHRDGTEQARAEADDRLALARQALAGQRELSTRLAALESRVEAQATCQGTGAATIRHPPPHDLDVEQLILSALLEYAAPRVPRTPRERRNARVAPMGEQAFASIANRIEPADFFAESHGRVYEAILEVACDGAPLGKRRVTHEYALPDVVAWLATHGRLRQVGGPAYLAELAFQPHVTPARLRALAAHLIELRVLRDALATAQRLVAEIYTREADSARVEATAEMLLAGVREGRSRTNSVR